MSLSRLYMTPLHLHAMSPDSEVRRVSIDASAEGADAALAEAAEWLRSKVGFAAKVELLLSSSLVRFVTVPWIAGTFTGSAIRQQVERAVGATNGEDAAHWQFRIQWPHYGWPTFAVGYPSRLLSAADRALLAATLSVERSMAAAVAVVARHGAKMPRGAALIGFEEEDGLTGVHLNDGAITEVERLPRTGGGLDAPEIWCNRKCVEFPLDGQLRWLQADHCPPMLRERALTGAGSGSGCVATDLLMAVR